MIPYSSPLYYFDSLSFAFLVISIDGRAYFTESAFPLYQMPEFALSCLSEICRSPVFSKVTAAFAPALERFCLQKYDAIFFADLCHFQSAGKWYQFLRPNMCLFRKRCALYFLIPSFSPLYHFTLPVFSLCALALVTAFPNDALHFAAFALWYPQFRQIFPFCGDDAGFFAVSTASIPTFHLSPNIFHLFFPAFFLFHPVLLSPALFWP